LRSEIQNLGISLGFSQIAVAPLDLSSAEPHLQAWLAQNFHGEMDYMARHGMKRARPAELVPGTLSVVTARMNYLPRDTPADWQELEWQRLRDPKQAVVSLYARGRDYHKVLRQRLDTLARQIDAFLLAHAAELPQGGLQYRAFTDSAPVLEAELATRSGQGWRGKHTLVLNREAGSMFFLGEIFLNIELPASEPTSAHCGKCTACIDVCPTQAIVAPGVVDARRCISYLTIEHAGSIDEALRPLMGNRIYGCDDCQLICPWNKYAQIANLPDFDARAGLVGQDIARLLGWSEADFLRLTEGSAIRRIGHARWVRNLAVAAGNALRLEARQQPAQLDPFGRLDGVVGLQREANRLTAQGAEAFVPSSRTQSAALFTLQTLKTTWGQVSAAARAEGAVVASLDHIDSARFPTEEKRFTPHSLSVGVLRNFRQGEAQEGWQLTSNLGWSQRAPKDYELFANGPHAATGTFEQGDHRSALEKATQLDVGGAWKAGPHAFGLTGFVSRFTNYLSLQPTGEFKDAMGTLVGAATPDRLPVYQYEGVQARFVGVESTAKLRMVGGQKALWTPNASHGNLDLELRADTVRADDVTHKRPLPRIAPLRLGADWVWTQAAWGARLGVLHAGAQQRVPNVGNVTTASYTLLNAGVNYHTHTGATHWMVFAKLDNLTNQLAYSSTSVLTQTMGANAPPLAGRSLKLGVQVSL
jgi:epoxyqueuosine reductase